MPFGLGSLSLLNGTGWSLRAENQLLTQWKSLSGIAARRLVLSWRASGTPRIDPACPVESLPFNWGPSC